MRPSSSIGIGSSSASPTSTSSPPSSRASSIESSVEASATSSTTTFDAASSRPVSGLQSTWMSSPPLNCFFAAARTASLIASITKSRSMPCSWQRASMFWAMLVLMSTLVDELSISVRALLSILLYQIPISCFVLSRLPEFLFDVHFQICFRYIGKRNREATTRLVFKDNILILNPNNLAAKVPLVINCRTRLQLRLASRKPLVIRELVKPALDARRRNFQRISRVNEILDVQNRADLRAHPRTIVVSHSTGFINEHSNYRVTFRASEFRVNQLNSVVDRGLFSDLVNLICN